jgi:hypothetical protein
MFNAETFLNTQVSDAMSTQLDPVPKGEFKAVSQPVDANSFSTFDYKKGDRAGQKGHRMTVMWKIDDESAGEYNGRTVRQQFIIDVTADGTGLDAGKGKNITLGRLREALGQNVGGQPWHPGMLGSQIAKISVDQRFDPDDASKIYNEVTSVVRL